MAEGEDIDLAKELFTLDMGLDVLERPNCPECGEKMRGILCCITMIPYPDHPSLNYVPGTPSTIKPYDDTTLVGIRVSDGADMAFDLYTARWCPTYFEDGSPIMHENFSKDDPERLSISAKGAKAKAMQHRLWITMLREAINDGIFYLGIRVERPYPVWKRENEPLLIFNYRMGRWLPYYNEVEYESHHLRPARNKKWMGYWQQDGSMVMEGFMGKNKVTKPGPCDN